MLLRISLVCSGDRVLVLLAQFGMRVDEVAHLLLLLLLHGSDGRWMQITLRCLQAVHRRLVQFRICKSGGETAGELRWNARHRTRVEETTIESRIDAAGRGAAERRAAWHSHARIESAGIGAIDKGCLCRVVCIQ